jgi:hypothetical protein
LLLVSAAGLARRAGIRSGLASLSLSEADDDDDDADVDVAA